MRSRHRGDLDGQGRLRVLAEGGEAIKVEKALLVPLPCASGIGDCRRVAGIELPGDISDVTGIEVCGRKKSPRRPKIPATYQKADLVTSAAHALRHVQQRSWKFKGFLSFLVVETGRLVERLLFGGGENAHSGHEEPVEGGWSERDDFGQARNLCPKISLMAYRTAL